MTATLEIQSAPELGLGIKWIIIDCDHGTTTGLFVPSPSGSGPTIIHIDLRDGHFYNQRHIDDLVDQLGQRITQHLLPTAGVQFRR